MGSFFDHDYIVDGDDVDYATARHRQYDANDLTVVYRTKNGEPFGDRLIDSWLKRDKVFFVSQDGSVIATKGQPGDF